WGFHEEDATAPLQSALDSGVKTLIIDKQSGPWNVTTLRIPSDIEIIIDSGVTVQAKAGAFREPEAYLFSVDHQKNVVLRGRGADSVLKMRKSDYRKPPYEKSEWRHGICLRSVRNVRIEDLTICSSGGDGIYLGADKKGAPCENVTIRHVVCDDNHRQGISVISARNLLIEECVLSNTEGTPPESGIDFEPNSDRECLVNCVVRGCLFEKNKGNGIELWIGNLTGHSEPISILFENCVSRRNKKSGFFEGIYQTEGDLLRGELVVRDCLLADNNIFALRCYSKSAPAHALRLENVTLDVTGTKTLFSPIRLVVEKVDRFPARFPIGGMTWDVTVVDPAERPIVDYQDQTENGFGLFDISGTVTKKKSAEDSGEVITIDEKWLAEQFPGVRAPEETADEQKE
ncbi:MAG: right-handed parallel beta-helix repeat-containing protein, partial [Thermoguttaceae bacterium]|nr:right-handed parallel beta-helix repeat-containing protein [Thermoguttaceae bacterium]